LVNKTKNGPKSMAVKVAEPRQRAEPKGSAVLADVQPRVSPHGILTAISMMKDEGPYVLEWIAHHLAVGFTRIIVYTNDCTDGTDLMLMRLEELGLAFHRVNAIPEGQRPQPSALNYAQEEPLVAASDWVMVFDADEFLCIKYGDGTLDDMLSAAKAQGANGIVVTWRIFGSGGIQHWSRAMVSEQYLMAAPPSWNKGWGVKTLFTFDPEYWKLGIHRPKLKNKWLETDFPDTVKWLNGSGRPMEDYFKFRGWRSITRTVGYDWAQLNHYAVKSIDSYAIRKFRGNVNFKKDKYNSDYWSLQDRNEVRDDAMLRYTNERRRIFDVLLTDPVLNRLHFAALDRAETKLAEFKATPAYDDLVSALKAASEVPIDQVEAKPPQARDPEKIAALMSEVERLAAKRQKDDRRKTPQDRPAGKLGLYLSNPKADTSVDSLTWHANQEIELPVDPQIFSPLALTLIAAGKFERNLARNLPKLLAQGAVHVEVGGGCGFMAAHLKRQRPDLTLYVTESDPALRSILFRVWDRNGILPDPNLQFSDAPLSHNAKSLGEHLLRTGATSVALSDPALEPDVLRDALSAAGASLEVIILTNRLLAARSPDLPEIEAILRAAGFSDRAPIDANLALAFKRSRNQAPHRQMKPLPLAVGANEPGGDFFRT
jgi:hypothetical protein